MKGGHARSGPPPDPNALRRNRKDDETWVTLPAEGRQGDPPEWPLSPKATKRQAALWEQLWAKPQAVQWEARGQELEVALYVRRLSEAEKPNASTSLTAEVRRMMEHLGLSGMGLRANRWRIAATNAPSSYGPGQGVQAQQQPPASSDDVRARLTVVREDSA